MDPCAKTIWEMWLLFGKLDRFLLSDNWESRFPRGTAKALPRVQSDHTPISMDTNPHIPPKKIVRFEKMWLQNENFESMVRSHWELRRPISYDPCKVMTHKLKDLRFMLRW